MQNNYTEINSKTYIAEAEIQDLPNTLSLQKIAYQSEAELVGDYSIPPLTQTLDGITADFNEGFILKAVLENIGEIIGSVRGKSIENTLHIGRLIVESSRQNQGIGTALLKAAETMFPQARYELFTSDKSGKNLSLYIKNEYKEFKREPLVGKVNLIYLQKEARL